MHRFWDCAVSGCKRAASIDTGGCERCRSMFCAGHASSKQHHDCDKSPLDDDAWLAAQTSELAALASKVDEQALVRRAQDLSGGKACRLDPGDPLGRRLMGGMHVHRELLFDDGTTWLVRMLRENYTSFDDATSNQILLSECATLQWLAAHVGRERIPAPRLHGFGLRGDKSNDVGVAYMLIDKLPGRPFEPHAATAEQTAKVLDQWAGMLCELGQHPLDQVGSLTFEAGEGGCGRISVGPVASDRTGTLPCTLGPFSDARCFYAAWADAHLDAISDGQLCSAHPVDAYLMFRWIKDQMAAVDGRTTNPGGWASLVEAEALDKGPFILRHVDDKGDHLLVDDDYNITGVIDWTFARTAPVYEAFAPALMTGDTSSLFSGTPGISAADRFLEQALQRHGAPYSFFDADPMRRLLLGIGVGLGLTLSETIAVFQCIVSTWSGGAETIPDWSAWRAAQLARDHSYRDARLAAILRHERPPPPRFTTCAFSAGCDRPGVRKSRCPVCSRHLCALHWRPQYHTCKPVVLDDDAWDQSLTDEVEALLARLNIPALERRASAIRDGVPCRFHRAKHLGAESTMGCANYNAWIIFADGVRWVARLPRTTDGSDLPADFVDYLVASEYATLRFIEQTMPRVRAPRAYGFGLSADPVNEAGMAYLLEEALPGRPFQAYDATSAQKEHVFRQYSGILADISQHPVQQACSLRPGDGDEIQEGPIASDRFVRLAQHGPYPDALSYFASVADLHLDLIADGQIFPDTPRDAFVFYRLLRDRAAPVLAASAAATASPLQGFFLKHADDKGDHILVDEDYTITGIIDWQFARFVPAIEAFGPSLVTADMGSLYDGVVGLSADDLFMAALLRGGPCGEAAASTELARRFQFGLASGLSSSEASSMLGAVLRLLGIEHSTAAEWAAAEWAKARDDNDPRWQRIEDQLGADAGTL